MKLYSRKMMVFFLWTLLFTSVVKGASSIEVGKDIIFLQSTQNFKFGNMGVQYSLKFKEISPNNPKYSKTIQFFLKDKGFQRIIKDYCQLVKKLKKKRKPFAFVLSKGRQSISYCNIQPYLVQKNGRQHLQIGPIIYLDSTVLKLLQSPSYSGRVLYHEMAHAILASFLSIKNYNKFIAPEYFISLLIGEGHWKGKQTDPIFAFSEGYAEYFSDFYGSSKKSKSTYPYLKNWNTLSFTEGAIANLFLKLSKESTIPSFHQKLLLVLAKKHPSHIYSTLQLFAKTYPTDAPQMRTFLHKLSKGKFNFERKYKTDQLFKDSKKNWQRLIKLGRARTKGMLEKLVRGKTWKYLGKEIWKAYPYLKRELKLAWPDIKRRLKRELQREVGWQVRNFWRWIRKKMPSWRKNKR